MKFNYCHGWTLDCNYNEITCKHRDKCQFYSEDFYRIYAGRLDEFEEMFPFDPCPHFLPRHVKEEATEGEPSLLDMLFSNLENV